MERNYDVSIFIVTESNVIIESKEYDAQFNDPGVFVMICNDELNQEYQDDNTFAIHKNWKDQVGGLGNADNSLMEDTRNPDIANYGHTFCKYEHFVSMSHTISYLTVIWQAEPVYISDKPYKKGYQIDFNGYKNTQYFLNIAQQLLREHNKELRHNGRNSWFNILNDIHQYFPAAMMAYDTIVKFDGRMVHGFLPAMEQLMYISKNITGINEALLKIQNHDIYLNINNMNHYWWSSSESDKDYTWFLLNRVINGCVKNNLCNVLPCFKIL